MKICNNSKALEFTFRLSLFIAMTHHILHRAKHNTKSKSKFFQLTLTFTLSDVTQSRGFWCVKVFVL